VVEKLHIGRDVGRAAVEIEPQIDLGFFGRAFDDRPPVDQLTAP